MLTKGHEPLSIDTVEVPTVSGVIGLCACPGGRRIYAPDYDPHRDMDKDLDTLKAWGAEGVVSLIEHEEFLRLGVTQLPERIEDQGLWWRHLPVPDMRAPTPEFERRWLEDGPFLRKRLIDGGRFVVHCFAGLGRTGTVAARLLVEFGMEPGGSMTRVRGARPRAIQSVDQEDYISRCQPIDTNR